VVPRYFRRLIIFISVRFKVAMAASLIRAFRSECDADHIGNFSFRPHPSYGGSPGYDAGQAGKVQAAHGAQAGGL
jgi:hypothetical protein